MSDQTKPAAHTEPRDQSNHMNHAPHTLSLVEIVSRFPDEATAMKWFEDIRWKDGRTCGICYGTKTSVAKHPRMPYWCKRCRKYFSVKTGTIMEHSNIPYHKWAIAMHLYLSRPKGISSIQLAKDIGVTQQTAWFMGHRIREAWRAMGRGDKFAGPVEIDEVYLGGRDRNKHARLKGSERKIPIAGIRDRSTGMVRAQPVPETTSARLGYFIHENAEADASHYTDESPTYHFLRKHHMVNHNAREYGHGDVHINGIESFWALLRRGYTGTYHYMSRKHMHRYVGEFTGRLNAHKTCQDHMCMLRILALHMFGRILPYRRLVA